MAALGDVHRRHEALHARYRRVDPPVAIIPPNPGMPQLLLLTDATTTQDALDQLADAVQQPLDYTQGRNWRTALIRDRSTNRTLLGIGIHHIAFDGWSHTILVRDLTHAYTARATGKTPEWDRPAPTLHHTYDEHTRLHDAADLATQREYWRTQLHRLPCQGDGELKVPLEQALAWGPKAGHILTVSPQILQRWDQAAREHRFSRSSYFVAAFATALRAVHQQDDMPGFAYQDNAVLPLDLPGCRTEEVVEPYAREVMSGLTVEAIPRHADALLRITIRTDLLPFALAEELGAHMLRFLEAGPQVTGPAR
ncbi:MULTISPECIES: condensation domain-containing protein [unclassified Micromonospora]|uniref:condensation domain-containing protein n=1 Tax=unclassified Micromonospora TaxID=2617518 RepID=UPI003628738E